METRESAKLCRELEALGAMTLAITPDERGGAGWPDKYVAHHRWSGWLELKTGRRALTPLQRLTAHELRRRGVNAWAVRILDDGLVIEDPDGRRWTKVADADELLDELGRIDRT